METYICKKCGARFKHPDVIYMPDMANPYPTDIIIEVCPKCGSTDITTIQEST